MMSKNIFPLLLSALWADAPRGIRKAERVDPLAKIEGTLEEEYELIQQKKSKLSASQRMRVIKIIQRNKAHSEERRE